MLKSLFLVLIIYILNIKSYEIKINYLSNINYTNYECGGKIIFNDTTIYPPCKSFIDTLNRSKQIIRDNNFNSSIKFYLIKNDDGKELVLKDSIYFRFIDFFENIEISVVNENLEKLDWKKSLVILQQSNYAFICLTIEKSQNNNKNQSITIEGFQFKNWNEVWLFGSYNNKVDNIFLYNNRFYNSSSIFYLSSNDGYEPDLKSLDLHNVNNIIINNCIFENTYDLSCYIGSKSAILKNVQFIGNSKSLILGNTNYLLIDNCIFINNTISNGGTIVNIINKNGTVRIINSQLINNDITKFLIAGDYQTYGIMHVYISNCTFSDNIFRRYSGGFYEPNLFILFISQKDSWILEIKDTIIQRKFSENMPDPGCFFHSNPASGNVVFSNLSIINYSFMELISVTKTNITIINTPSFDKSLVIGSNNTIQLIDNSNNTINNKKNNNKIKIIIITVTTVSIFIIISIIILIVVKKNKNIIKSFIINNKNNNINKNNNHKNDKIDNSNIYLLETSSMGTAACDNVTVKSESTNITENSKKSTVEN